MMFNQALSLAIALVPSTLAAPGLSKINARVAGGNLAQPGEFPFLVAPTLNGERQWCGGTLLNAYTVLTAAHCSINVPAENVTVRAGSVYWQSCGTVSNITEIRIHPGFRAVVGQNDIAVWHLATPLQPSDTIGYAKVVPQGYDPPLNLSARTAGWGNTVEGQVEQGSAQLSWVNVPIVSRDECRALYSSATLNELCAGGEKGKGSCPNDSGGPIWNPKTLEIMGTVHSGGGCGLKGKPTLYTNLGALSDWVHDNMWSS